MRRTQICSSKDESILSTVELSIDQINLEILKISEKFTERFKSITLKLRCKILKKFLKLSSVPLNIASLIKLKIVFS